jgi:hypothetical protein
MAQLSVLGLGEWYPGILSGTPSKYKKYSKEKAKYATYFMLLDKNKNQYKTHFSTMNKTIHRLHTPKQPTKINIRNY